MKTLLAGLVAALLLSGCIVVDRDGGGYHHRGYYNNYYGGYHGGYRGGY